MKVLFNNDGIGRTLKFQIWFVTIVLMLTILTQEILTLNGSFVCTVKQKYNVTKRVKYRAPMSVRTYEWCFAVPPRCSKWTTELRDLTRIETEERIAEVAICCPGYKIKDVACVPICPHGKTGSGCSEDCPSGKWGPNCANVCNNCTNHGACSPITGECVCQDGWKGERCELSNPVIPPSVTEQTPTPTVLYVQSTQTLTPSTFVIKPTETQLKENSISLSTEKTENVFEEATTRTQHATTSIEATGTTQTNRLEYNPVSTEKKNLETNIQTTVPNFDINYTNYTPIDTTAVKQITEITTQRPEHLKSALNSTVKPDVTSKVAQVTNKFRPKEIWIRPAQKGESTLTDTKIRHELYHPRSEITKKEISSDKTTPKTIIVSIIPTSVAYTTFKKISLTTSPLQKESHETLRIQNNVTKRTKMPVFSDSPSTPMSLFTIKLLSTAQSRRRPYSTTIHSAPVPNISKSMYDTSHATNVTSSIPTTNSFTTKPTNSLNDVNTTRNFSSNNNLTTNTLQTTTYNLSTKMDTPLHTKKTKAAIHTTEHNIVLTTIPVSLQNISSTMKKKMTSTIYSSMKATKPITKLDETKNRTLTTLTTLTTNVYETISTKESEDETFHILTEPEHITAVIGERGGEKNSLDLVSVISIAGGVMLAVITVAVLVVMVERCRKAPYQRVRKLNDLRMKVIMEAGDPPPYTRSIFHTPLPDPPTSEKCHYQPISTLDRNVKQFMRPVIVQAISPVMLENFRGIIECHYDHLPKRSYDNNLTKVITAPSMDIIGELPRGPSFTDSVIDAMKCEAKFDVIDHTTSEPLYAEIPAWRPPSEHAVEIINLNGEAVTEL